MTGYPDHMYDADSGIEMTFIIIRNCWQLIHVHHPQWSSTWSSGPTQTAIHLTLQLQSHGCHVTIVVVHSPTNQPLLEFWHHLAWSTFWQPPDPALCNWNALHTLTMFFLSLLPSTKISWISIHKKKTLLAVSSQHHLYSVHRLLVSLLISISKVVD